MSNSGKLWVEIFGSLKCSSELRSCIASLYAKNDDCQKMIKSLLEDGQLRDVIKSAVRETCVQSKSIEKSNSFRKIGNSFFGKGNNVASLWTYNKSIIYSPKGESLALAIGNRSASLFHLECYQLCARDIKWAFDEGYPQKLHPKLYLRLGHCLMNTKSYKDAVEAFQNAKKSFGDEITSKIKGEIDVLIKECLAKSRKTSADTDEPKYNEIDSVVLPKVAYGINDSMPYASANLHIVKKSKKGRCVYAKKNLKAGDVLFCEPAYAFVLKNEEMKRRCHFCADSLIAPVPCSSCVEAIYCSHKCLAEAWKQYHSIECGYSVTNELGWPSLLALRIMLKAGVNLTEKASQLMRDNGSFNPNTSEEKISLQSNDSSTSSEGRMMYEKMDGLCTTIAYEDPCKRYLYVVVAVILSHFLCENSKWKSANSQLFCHKTGSQKLLQVLAEIALKHFSQAAANNFIARDLWSDEDLLHKLGWKNQDVIESKPSVKIDDDWHDVVGSGVYVSSSMLNHSCKPNTFHCYYKEHLIVKASEDIPEGSEVCIHYGRVYTRADIKERRKFLKDNCFFDCECEACSNPSKFNARRSRAFRCPLCKGPLISRKEMFEDEEHFNSEMKCLNCKAEMNKQNDFDDGVEIGHMSYISGMEAQHNNDLERACTLFHDSLRVLKQFYFHENLAISQMMDRISLCYSHQEKYDEALKYWQLSLPILESNFGAQSSEVAFELQKGIDVVFSTLIKMTDIALFRERHKLGMCYIDKALTNFAIHGGPWIRAVRDLELMKMKFNELLMVSSGK